MALWTAVAERLALSSQSGSVDEAVAVGRAAPTFGYGQAYLTRARLGQWAFRVLVTDAYERRCAVTVEKTLPILEAAHIRPFSSDGPNLISNGLLLRSDVHKLFDLGYLSVSDQLTVEVSPRLRDDYGNGRDYYNLQGRQLLVVPSSELDRPDLAFLAWRNDHIYLT